MNTKIGGDLLDGHTVIAVTGDADDIIAELTGVGPGHTDILPAHPSRASQLRCHLIVQQTLGKSRFLKSPVACRRRAASHGKALAVKRRNHVRAPTPCRWRS